MSLSVWLEGPSADLATGEIHLDEPEGFELSEVIARDVRRELTSCRIKARYVDMLQPLFDTGKPVVVTEFGMRTYVGADTSGTLGFGIVPIPSLVLHKLIVVGRFVRTRLKACRCGTRSSRRARS